MVKAESIEVIENTGEAQSLIEVDVSESVDQLFTDFDEKKSRKGKEVTITKTSRKRINVFCVMYNWVPE